MQTDKIVASTSGILIPFERLLAELFRLFLDISLHCMAEQA